MPQQIGLSCINHSVSFFPFNYFILLDSITRFEYFVRTQFSLVTSYHLCNYRSESLLFTKWAAHLKPHTEQEVQARQRPLSTKHDRSPHIRRENPTAPFASSHDVIRQTAMSHASCVGTFIPVHCPQRRDVRVGPFGSSSPLGFLVSMGGVPPQPTRQRKTMKKRDNNYLTQKT